MRFFYEFSAIFFNFLSYIGALVWGRKIIKRLNGKVCIKGGLNLILFIVKEKPIKLYTNKKMKSLTMVKNKVQNLVHVYVYHQNSAIVMKLL